MIDQLVSQYGLPILVSASVALGAQFVSNSTDSAFLKQNIEATQELSRTMKGLELSIGIFQERYPTRVEVEQRIKEAVHGS